MVKAPNFFIVGAPKCGTSFLHYRLAAHPEVFMHPQLKEPHHFATDLHGDPAVVDHLQWVPDRAAYLALFAGATEHVRRIGEASVFYLMSSVAAAAIARFNPTAKIVIMLRNPADLLESLHAQSLYSCLETEADFGRAYLRDREAATTAAPRPERMFFRYPTVVDFGTQLARFTQHFAPDQLHVIVQEEMRADTRGTFRRVLEFLAIDPEFTPDFTAENERKEARSQILQRLTHNAPLGLRRTLRRLTSPALRIGLKAWIARLNSRPIPRTPLAPELRETILHDARPAIDAVEAYLGRNLPAWRH